MDKNAASLKQKIAIFILAFVFFFGLLEIGLRVVGSFYIWNYNPTLDYFGHPIKEEFIGNSYRNESKGVYKILCVGDSYTFGGEEKYETVYPYLLQEKLNEHYKEKNFLVFNGGSCEYNSRQVLVRLPNFIHKYDPDMIIVLVGGTNRFNLALSDLRGGGFLGFLRSFRIYKMAKIIAMNLDRKFLKLKPKDFYFDKDDFGIDGYEKANSRYVKASEYLNKMSSLVEILPNYTQHQKAWVFCNNKDYSKALEIYKTLSKEQPNDIKIVCDMAHVYYKLENIKKAEEIYNKVYSLNPDSEFVLNRMAYFYNMLCRQGRPNVYYHLKAIEFDPFYNLHNYHNLLLGYRYQSEYDADFIIKFFDKLKEKKPKLLNHPLFVRYYDFFANQKQWDSKIDKWLMSDFKEIEKLCKDKDIELVVQNYPYGYALANRVSKEFAKKYSLVFVDNEKVFSQAIGKGVSLEEFLYDDFHCKPKGHSLMAENVFKTLILREEIFNQ